MRKSPILQRLVQSGDRRRLVRDILTMSFAEVAARDLDVVIHHWRASDDLPPPCDEPLHVGIVLDAMLVEVEKLSRVVLDHLAEGFSIIGRLEQPDPDASGALINGNRLAKKLEKLSSPMG
jgi:hypothetical protein